jgi:hypothetical protein
VGTERATAYLTSVEGSQRPSVFQRIAGQEWLGAYLVWLEQAYKQIVEEDVLPEDALAVARDKADDYRACVIANESINDSPSYRECMNQVNQAYSVSPSEKP